MPAVSTLREQVRSNAVALISLVIAITSLSYAGWRNETSELQRNVRMAAFTVLGELGQLQEEILYRAYYLPSSATQAERGRRRVAGYGHVLLIRDLLNLMPDPGPEAGESLVDLWEENVNRLSAGANTPDALQAEKVLTHSIDMTRKAVVEILAQLD